jgi:glycosyltransferase involved in cell wall biosynthesis
VVTAGKAPKRQSIVILVENLSVPFDRRVWQECLALDAAGYDVHVICPSSKQDPEAYAVIEGVQIHRYPADFEAAGMLGFLREYGTALFHMTRLSWRIRRRTRISVIQACNPPDVLFLVALPHVLLGRTRFIFDHHDVSPELLLAKGLRERSAMVRFAYVLERLTFRLAHVSIATNESYREVAITRGHMDSEDVYVVRSGPDLRRFAPVAPNDALKRGRRFLVGYVGVMGRQEGIDYLLEAARHLVVDKGREDVHFMLAGAGPELARLRDRVAQLGMSSYIEFRGRVSNQDLLELLTTADVCVNPDEWNRMNDMSTMNKILEYMAVGKPVVQFDLREGRVSAADASLYVTPNDAVALGDGIASLLDDPEARARMGAIGRQRVATVLNWDAQVPKLLAAYAKALGEDPRATDQLRDDRLTRHASRRFAPGPWTPVVQPASPKFGPPERRTADAEVAEAAERPRSLLPGA